MRLGTVAAATATIVIGAGAAAVAVGRYASDVALKPSPGHPLPGDSRLTVHSADGGHVILTRSLASLRPGIYGLAGAGCHAVAGPVVHGTPHPPDAVVRRLERVTHGTLRPGTRMRMTPQVHIGNPHDALGIACADVDVPGELGPLPAWFVPGVRDTWVITVHGISTTREHPMVVMPFLARHRLPVLDLAYRNDLGAPRSADGIHHFGDTEWRDLDAAIRYAVRYGARTVIVHGWSTGATMALRAAANSALRDRISGLVLDSPVLDRHATVRALAAARHVPRALLPLVVRAAEGTTGLPVDRPADAPDPEALQVPTLLFHGPGDTVAPWTASRDFAARRPDLITLQPVPHAPHAAMWNADPDHYEEILRRFLTPLM
ncbi:alpha/beta hydrolase family protein [Streptomyces sp. YGL11-2]|uniref:alpha/beta hydrolase family protein n=1 Tax=Streptomyces sp. YGL11-2 TaxID=3414028 RepID=UPI003CE833A5